MSKRLTSSGSFTVATIEDGVSVEAQYAPNNNPTPSQIHTTWRDGDIYMRTRESDSSTWSSWHKMVGESGGETVYSFNISQEKTSGSATTAPSNCFYPTWRDTPIAPTSAYPYLWMQIQKKDGNGNPVGVASYARVTGELGIDYEIRCAIDSIKIPKDTTSTSVSTTFNFYYKESGKTPIAYNAYYGIYYRVGTTYTLISNGSSSSASLSAYSVDNTKTAIVVFIFSASYSGNYPMSQSYLAKLELPIYGDGKDGLAPNPNILLRTVFDRGIDKVKEKWAGDWNYVGIDAASDTVIDGRKSIRISAEYASTYKDFTQNVYGRIKTDTWYTLSFYYYSTSDFWTYIYDGVNTYGIVDRTAGYYIDGVYNSGDLGIDAEHRWIWEWMGKRHSITFKTKSSFGTTNALILFRCPQGVQVAICMPKLEIGKDVTTYIPNEDDLVGNDGQSIRGKTGRFYYYAQEWSSDPNVSYAVTDAEAPYFLYNGNYWVFNPTSNGTYTMSAMGTPSSSNENWKLMVTDFKFIIAEAIFGDYAHFGSAIINGDWLLSSNGKVNGAEKTKDDNITGTLIRSSGNTLFSTKPYTLFSPENPLNDHETILSSDTAITIGATATTKTITSQYLEAGRVYHLSLRGYKYTNDSQLCIRIRNSYYGSYQHTYFTTTASQYYITFKVETSATYTIELYQPTLSSSSSGGGTVTSYMLLRFLYKPAYAVDLKTGESYQTRVYASGGMRSPFSYLAGGGTFTEKMSDNIGVYSTSTNAGTNYYIPCDVSQSGRKICVTNYYFNGHSSYGSGWATLNMSNRGSEQYFYEDGIMKTTLKLSREGVELLGYGNETTFYGWIVIKRFDLGTEHRYGHHMKMLAVANVNVTKSGSTTSANISYHAFDDTTLGVTRTDVGTYTVSWSNGNWFKNADSVFVMICGLGRTVDAGDNPIFASVKSKTSTSFVAQVADDSSLNDGSFSFFLMNFDDWVYLH